MSEISSHPLRYFVHTSSSAIQFQSPLFVRHITYRLPIPSFTSFTIKQFRYIPLKISDDLQAAHYSGVDQDLRVNYHVNEPGSPHWDSSVYALRHDLQIMTHILRNMFCKNLHTVTHVALCEFPTAICTARDDGEVMLIQLCDHNSICFDCNYPIWTWSVPCLYSVGNTTHKIAASFWLRPTIWHAVNLVSLWHHFPPSDVT